MSRTLEPTRRHERKLPMLSEKEMQILRQKPASQTIVLMQGLALSLLNEEDGFYKALEVLLGSCKDISRELAQKMLRDEIELLRKGNVLAWRRVMKETDKRPKNPVCMVMRKLAPPRGKLHV